MAPRGIKTAALALMAAMMITLICACAADGPTWDAITPDETPAATAAPANPNEERMYDRLELMRHEELVDEQSVMICPAVADDEYGYLSTLIAIRVRSRIRSYDYAVSTAFRIKCNSNGVLSMLIGFYDMETDELIDKLPITYDLALGREIQIQDCFEEGDGAWRSCTQCPRAIRSGRAAYDPFERYFAHRGRQTVLFNRSGHNSNVSPV